MGGKSIHGCARVVEVLLEHHIPFDLKRSWNIGDFYGVTSSQTTLAIIPGMHGPTAAKSRPASTSYLGLKILCMEPAHVSVMPNPGLITFRQFLSGTS